MLSNEKVEIFKSLEDGILPDSLEEVLCLKLFFYLIYLESSIYILSILI